MKLGFRVGNSKEARDAIISGLLLITLEILNKLPEGEMPTPLNIYQAVRFGIIAGLVFWLANKGIKVNKNAENE